MPKSKGCSNGVSHLRWCISHGDYDHLVSEHESNLSKNQSFIGFCFKTQLHNSDKEKETTEWLELIIDEESPLRTVVNKPHRKFRKITMNFSAKMLRDIILMMVKLVEKIGCVIKESERWSMFHDGWSKNGVHRVRLFTCFVKKTLDRKEKGKEFYENVVKFFFISRLWITWVSWIKFTIQSSSDHIWQSTLRWWCRNRFFRGSSDF